MRVKWTILAAAAAGLALAPQSSVAEESDVQAQLRAMQERMEQLESRLQATDDQLAEAQDRVTVQREMIERAGLDEDGDKSALSSFLENTDFAGWVAASYAYNVADPNRGTGFGPLGEDDTLSNPFHPDHSSLQLDELWLSAGRAADEDSRAGFQFDIVYGETAALFNGINGINSNSLWINQAYIEYLSPYNVLFTAGKFGTHIGYEVAGAPLNVNITRGFIYTNLQPFSQTGVKAAVETDSGVNFMIGGVSGISEAQVDVDDEVDLIASLGYGTDTFSGSLNLQWGYDAETLGFGGPPGTRGDNDDALIADLVLEMTPSDNLLAWVDTTYAQIGIDGSPSTPWAVGVAVGGRVGVTDRMGIGGRFEYAHADTDGLATPLSEADAYSATVTMDYALVENLILKGEYKYETVMLDGVSDFIFPSGAFGLNDDQHLLIAQLYYTF
jgi:hypothetical protein